MGILTRFKDIMSANINSLLDKMEDPSKMIDEYMRKAVEDLAEVKQETAEIMAEEKRCKRLLEANKEQINKYEDLAKKALKSGSEEDAKVFLAKKQEYVEAETGLQKAYTIAFDNSVKMREMHDKLTKDINSLEQRRKTVKANVAVAKTQDRINNISNSMEKNSKTMQAFERMEEKSERMLDKANSMAELNETHDKAIDLEEKYSSAPISVEEDLERLKKELNMEDKNE